MDERLCFHSIEPTSRRMIWAVRLLNSRLHRALVRYNSRYRAAHMGALKGDFNYRQQHFAHLSGRVWIKLQPLLSGGILCLRMTPQAEEPRFYLLIDINWHVARSPSLSLLLLLSALMLLGYSAFPSKIPPWLPSSSSAPSSASRQTNSKRNILTPEIRYTNTASVLYMPL